MTRGTTHPETAANFRKNWRTFPQMHRYKRVETCRWTYLKVVSLFRIRILCVAYSMKCHWWVNMMSRSIKTSFIEEDNLAGLWSAKCAEEIFENELRNSANSWVFAWYMYYLQHHFGDPSLHGAAECWNMQKHLAEQRPQNGVLPYFSASLHRARCE